MAAKPRGSRRGSGRTGWAQYLSLSALGIEMGATLVVGMAIGWFLDRVFGTRPWLIIIFSLFGIAAGFRNLIRLARDKGWMPEDEPDEPGDAPPRRGGEDER